MIHILDKNKQYVFKINDYFDVVYFNGFIVKSKRYDFSIGQVIYSENEELIEQCNKKYPLAGRQVSGLDVNPRVDNTNSISASFNDYFILKGRIATTSGESGKRIQAVGL